MQAWRAAYLGLHELPRELTSFELQTFFSFARAERDVINLRRTDALKLGLALHIGFVRMSGRPLHSVRVLPVSLWRHLGTELRVPVPDVASLRALYDRGRTFFDHQQLACETLRLHWMSEHQRRALVRALGEEVSRAADRRQLLIFARCWLNERRLLIAHDRILRALVSDAATTFELDMASKIEAAVPERTLRRWRESLVTPRSDGESAQAWLWAAPTRHSTRQISEMLERIAVLTELGVDQHQERELLEDLATEIKARIAAQDLADQAQTAATLAQERATEADRSRVNAENIALQRAREFESKERALEDEMARVRKEADDAVGAADVRAADAQNELERKAAEFAAALEGARAAAAEQVRSAHAEAARAEGARAGAAAEAERERADARSAREAAALERERAEERVREERARAQADIARVEASAAAVRETLQARVRLLEQANEERREERARLLQQLAQSEEERRQLVATLARATEPRAEASEPKAKR